MRCGLGLNVHTGWAACVVVGGVPEKPQILANTVIDIVEGPERFCFHRAAEMSGEKAASYLRQLRTKAIARARRGLSPLLVEGIAACAVVAKDGALGDLTQILASHPRIHTAEGLFYRDVLREACPLPTRIYSPASFDPASIGKLAPAPWGRDQKLAALAAWAALAAAAAP